MKVLLISFMLWGMGTVVKAQTINVVKTVRNSSTGGDGSAASPGDILIYTIKVTNPNSTNITNAKLYDNMPAGVSYVAGSTTLNTTAVPDVSGAMPFGSSGGIIKSPTYGSGVLAPGVTATIVFKVKVTANGGKVTNYASVQGTYNGNALVTSSNPVVTSLSSIDATCSLVFQMTPQTSAKYDVTKPIYYNVLQTVNTATGKASAWLYDGSTGPCYDATNGDDLGNGTLLSDGSAAIAYDPSTKRVYFVLNTANRPALGYIDLSGPSAIAYSYPGNYLEPKTTSGYNINRMAWASDGYGYALTSNAMDLIKFYVDASNTPIITQLGKLIDDPNNGSNSVFGIDEVGGDIFADGSGKLYLIANSNRLFKINPKTRITTYMGMASPPPPGYSQSIAIDANGTVYIGGAYNYVDRIDLATMKIDTINKTSTNSVYYSSDFASCGFPVLSNAIEATKTYKNINGSSTVVGGDTVEYIITVSNFGNINAAGVKLYDYIPPSTTYLPGTTKLNGVTKPDAGTVMPFAVSGGALVNSPGEAAGIIKPGAANSAVVTFNVKTDPLKTICNQSKITLYDADGNAMFVNSNDASSGTGTPTCFFSDEILPLTGLKFRGNLINDQSILYWSMIENEGVSYYEVEYSENGVSFTTIGKVDAKGTPNETDSYSFTDTRSSSSSVRFYRLRIVQKGGTENYSGFVRLNIKGLDAQVTPNPFNKTLNVQLQLKTQEKVDIRLLDFYGRPVFTQTEQLSAGINSFSFTTPVGLAKGFYLLEIKAGNTQLFQQKLMKQ